MQGPSRRDSNILLRRRSSASPSGPGRVCKMALQVLIQAYEVVLRIKMPELPSETAGTLVHES